MSGGSFEYVSFNLDSEPFNPKVERELTRMAAALNRDEHGYLSSVPNAPEIRAELRALIGRLAYLEGLAITDAKRFVDLTYAIEWYASGDSGVEPIEREYRKLIGIDESEAVK